MRNFLNKWLPILWGGLWLTAITLGSAGMVIALIEWVLVC